MNNKIQFLIGSFFVFCLSGCVSTSDSTSEDRDIPRPVIVTSIDFSLPKDATIAWHPEGVKFYTDARVDSAAIKKMIDQSIFDEFYKQGYNLKLHNENADYLLAYTAALSSSLADETILLSYGLLPGNELTHSAVEHHEKGSLIILLLDAQTKAPVWKSAVQAGINFDDSNADRQKRIQATIHHIIALLMSKQAPG